MVKTTREIEQEKNMNVMKFLLGCIVFFTLIGFIIYHFGFVNPRLNNIAKWECYNKTFLTHKFDIINNTFYMIELEPIEIDVEEGFEGLTYFWNDSFYKLEEKEVCEIV